MRSICAGVIVMCAAGSAPGAGDSPAMLNNALNEITTNNSPALSVIYPRRIVDPGVSVDYADVQNTQAHALAFNNLRARSIATLPAPAAQVLPNQGGSSMNIRAQNVGFDNTAAQSRIIFTDAVTDDASALLAEPDYLTFASLGFFDLDVNVGNLLTSPGGLTIQVRGVTSTSLEGGAQAAGFSLGDHPYAVIVLRNAAGVPSVWSDFICIEQSPEYVQAASALIAESSAGGTHALYVGANQQLGDDANGVGPAAGGFTANNPQDTLLAIVDTFDVRGRSNVHPDLPLAQYFGFLPDSPLGTIDAELVWADGFRTSIEFDLGVTLTQNDLDFLADTEVRFDVGLPHNVRGIIATFPFVNTYAPIVVDPALIECGGDTNTDLVVNFTDLNTVIVQFGTSGADLDGDLDGNGSVGFEDLNAVLVFFGEDCY